MIKFPTRDEFAEHLTEVFSLHLENDARVNIVLHRVSDLVSRPPQEQYDLIFRVPASTPFGQGMYPVEHQKLGRLDLFLVPIEANEEWIKAQAVFNLLKDD